MMSRRDIFDALAAASSYAEARPLIGQVRLKGYDADTDYEQRVLQRALFYSRAHKKAFDLTLSDECIKSMSVYDLREALQTLEQLTSC